jgi:hypothetical protein
MYCGFWAQKSDGDWSDMCGRSASSFQLWIAAYPGQSSDVEAKLCNTLTPQPPCRDEDVKVAVVEWFKRQLSEFFAEGIQQPMRASTSMETTFNGSYSPPPLKVGWVRPKSGCLPLSYHIRHSPDDMSLESDGGMIYCQGKTEELGEKPVPVPLYQPQIPHGLARARTQAYAARGRRLTTWAMARP